jgi:hypothetical protein
MSLTYKLWDATSGAITLDPGWSLKEDIDKNLDLNRTPSGAATLYTYATWRNWEFQFRSIPTSVCTFIHSIFNSTRLCQLEVINGATSHVYSVMITNDKSPFQRLESPCIDRWQGDLALSVY